VPALKSVTVLVCSVKISLNVTLRPVFTDTPVAPVVGVVADTIGGDVSRVEPVLNDQI
jgi:hypothetical protein